MAYRRARLHLALVVRVIRYVIGAALVLTFGCNVTAVVPEPAHLPEGPRIPYAPDDWVIGFDCDLYTGCLVIPAEPPCEGPMCACRTAVCS